MMIIKCIHLLAVMTKILKKKNQHGNIKQNGYTLIFVTANLARADSLAGVDAWDVYHNITSDSLRKLTLDFLESCIQDG